MIPWLLGLFAGLVYLGGSELHRFENAAARDILTKLTGPRAEVRVHAELNGWVAGALGDLSSVSITARNFETEGLPLFTEPQRSQKGRVGVLHLDLRDFTIGGLRIQSLTAAIPDCRYDFALAVSKRQIRLSRCGVGHGSVEIAEGDLGAFVLRKFHEIKRVQIRVTRGRVLVEGYGEFLFVKTNFTVAARLVPVDGTRLMLTDAAILFDGQAADPLARDALLKTLNPVVDLNRDLKLHSAISVAKIDLENGVLRASGAATIPVRPQAEHLSPAASNRTCGASFRAILQCDSSASASLASRPSPRRRNSAWTAASLPSWARTVAANRTSSTPFFGR